MKEQEAEYFDQQAQIKKFRDEIRENKDLYQKIVSENESWLKKEVIDSFNQEGSHYYFIGVNFDDYDIQYKELKMKVDNMKRKKINQAIE